MGINHPPLPTVGIRFEEDAEFGVLFNLSPAVFKDRDGTELEAISVSEPGEFRDIISAYAAGCWIKKSNELLAHANALEPGIEARAKAIEETNAALENADEWIAWGSTEAKP